MCQFIDATWHFGVIEAEPALIIKGNPLERGTSSFEEMTSAVSVEPSPITGDAFDFAFGGTRRVRGKADGISFNSFGKKTSDTMSPAPSREGEAALVGKPASGGRSDEYLFEDQSAKNLCARCHRTSPKLGLG